jgi:hypothetical protein
MSFWTIRTLATPSPSDIFDLPFEQVILTNQVPRDTKHTQPSDQQHVIIIILHTRVDGVDAEFSEILIVGIVCVILEMDEVASRKTDLCLTRTPTSLPPLACAAASARYAFLYTSPHEAGPRLAILDAILHDTQAVYPQILDAHPGCHEYGISECLWNGGDLCTLLFSARDSPGWGMHPCTRTPAVTESYTLLALNQDLYRPISRMRGLVMPSIRA